jgi:hypothetical protein
MQTDAARDFIKKTGCIDIAQSDGHVNRILGPQS